MNYYYVDYMIRERQRAQRDECERLRMARMARLQSSDLSKKKIRWALLFTEFTHILKV